MKAATFLGSIAVLTACACTHTQPRIAEFTAEPILAVDTTVISFHSPDTPSKWMLLLDDLTGDQRKYDFTTDKDTLLKRTNKPFFPAVLNIIKQEKAHVF